MTLSTRGPSVRPYRRRTARPVATLLGVLLVITVLTWSVVFARASDGPSGAICPPPQGPLAAQWTGEPQPRTALDKVAPAPPATVRIRVLNGGGQRGQANLVASQLGEFGFTEAADPSNDPFYPNGDLMCRGNIRYGPNGASAARTVSLVLPCVPLVLDRRPDDSVDVAVGAFFGEVKPSKTAREVLDQLAGPSGQAQASDSTPSVDPELLSRVRDVPC